MADYKELIKTRSMSELIDEAIRLDKEMKETKQCQDVVKAEIQSRGLKDIEDRNARWIQYFAPEGSAAVADTQSLDVLNAEKLEGWLGSGVWEQNVTVTRETKYKYKSNLERALKAIFTDDYTFEYTLQEFLQNELHPDPGQEKFLLRKLKGEYGKDNDLLVSTLGAVPGGYDTELWYIHRIKNAELIRAYLPDEGIDATIQGIKKCLIVETTTKITLEYDKGDK